MSDQEHSNLDKQLKKIEGDVNWREERQRKAKQELIIKIEQRGNSQETKRKNTLSRKLVPALALLMIIGISIPLFMNENTSHEQTSIVSGDAANNVENEKSSWNIEDLPYEVSTDAEQSISAMIDAGFDLRLPQTAISDDMYIINAHKRINGEVEQVTTLFSYENEKQIRLSQESKPRSNEEYNKRIEQMKEDATENVTLDSGTQAYIVHKNGSTIYMFTDQFVFGMHSYTLAKDEIISFANSIEINDLDE